MPTQRRDGRWASALARTFPVALVLALIPALLPLPNPARAAAPAVAPAPGAGAAAVIYRCTAPGGAVALQEDPCPAGHREQRREIATFTPPAPAVAVAAPTPTPRIEISEAVVVPARPLAMPPPIWRCTDPEGRSRLADAFDPRPRCVPLSMLGVDLARAPPSAATLCRTVSDACVELGGEAACAAWEERLDAAESALRHAFSDTAAERRRERDRARAVVEGDCRP